ncbi:MAG: citrate transporter [Gammaproteobacteria bacterium]|nr:citrate transporter [Gammaproteobacteria bacterium]
MAIILTAATLTRTEAGPILFGVRAEFLLFALTLVGVALFHHRTLEVALTGLTAVILLKWLNMPQFHLGQHLLHEASILTNLLGLLLGFAVLARHFEQSQAPEILPRVLPDDWKGGFVLLLMVFVLSSFLDNIAAAMIGGTIAMHVFRGRVDVGFLAAIVAASNAGGSGSVVGDTTTTMMWIDGVSWTDVLHAYAAAVPALLFFGVMAARQQHALQPIQRDATAGLHFAPKHLLAVVMILAGTIITNVLLDFPAAGVWIAIVLAALFTKTDWKVVPAALKGSLFLLSLVTCASLMPVETLPPASWQSAFALGFISAVFDNIPLTKLALDQGGYDWGVLAYAVGFGGSMIWFGSSAGVALSNIFPQAKDVGAWVRRGWHVAAGYILGFFVMLWAVGWTPHPKHRVDAAPAHASALPAH